LPLSLTWVLPGSYLASTMNFAARSVPALGAPLTPFDTRVLDGVSDANRAFPVYFQTLSQHLGPLHWWPARTPFEVIVGAILVQNTAWSNVQRAIGNLRRARLLTPRAIERVSTARLERLVRPSGYFRQKAKKLKVFARFLRREYGGSLARMFRAPTSELRLKLLAVYGIGPETADSILLYAGGHAIFVVDAYTHRILGRHGLTQPGLGQSGPDYEGVRGIVEASLPHDANVYNEFHAQLVHVGKHWCRPRQPRCHECPLQPHLPLHSPWRLSEDEIGAVVAPGAIRP
jgi:endonuclease-3 related protein